MTTRIEALRAEESRLRSAQDDIEAQALAAGRDLTEEEETELGALRSSYDAVSVRIAEEGDKLAARSKTAEVLARFDAEQPSRVHVRSEQAPSVTPGEYASAYYRSLLGSPSEKVEAETLLRTVAVDATADTPGNVPTFIVGDLVKFVDASRPLVASSRQLPMPGAGKTFSRPRVTQRTTAAAQTEGSELSSTKLTTTGDTVTKHTHGGVLNLTEQDIDWTDPAMLQIAIEDLADSYAISTETELATAIATAATTTTPFDITTADGGDLFPALAAGASSVYSTSKKLPDTVYAAVNVWAYLAGLVDGQDRPLFPNLAPMNAPGVMDLTSFAGNPMGLRLIVSPHFADNFFAIASSRYVETYEQNKGLLQLPVPSLLEVQVAYRGYFTENVYAQGLCSLQ